ncbi:cobalt transport protein CbiN [Desulfosporosinus sp. FKB]|uniref:energy-coupling factor ABC transporter substrate-binding protein n=1 Tax=Desulfosporosinus sp. FKB TaxID=1969835 RepID=UPI000B4A048A|nr:cobalt transport protein CbiN [Desulfosporosinus sp. FKB]
MSKSKRTVIILSLIALLIAVVPLFMLKGAEFGGSDDAGSKVVAEITGTDYKPWVEPVMNRLIGGELPGEVESLLFCVQTGIGVGVVFFFLGRFVERSKWEKETGKKLG